MHVMYTRDASGFPRPPPSRRRPRVPPDARRGLSLRGDHGTALLGVARRGGRGVPGRGVVGRGEERVAELAKHARAEADDCLVLCPRWGVSLGDRCWRD